MSVVHAPVPGDPNRAPAVRDMFARIAPGYDRANRFMSMGIDRAWRRIAIRALGDAARGDVLDLCAGTMDFSAALAPNARSVVALDFCAPMLEAGRAKIPAGSNVRTLCADARSLPLDSTSFDAVVIGFGIRNVPEPERALAEARRVLRPGGVLVVVDFFRPVSLLAKLMAGTYNRVVLPIVGGLVTGDASAYRYLAGSMAAWYDRAGFERACVAAGFDAATGHDLFPPVASLVSARVSPGAGGHEGAPRTGGAVRPGAGGGGPSGEDPPGAPGAALGAAGPDGRAVAPPQRPPDEGVP